MWSALAMVVLGLVLAVLGLAILTGRGRAWWDESSRDHASPGPDAPPPLFTARSPVLAPARGNPSSVPEPSRDDRPVGQAPPLPVAGPEQGRRDVPAEANRGTAAAADREADADADRLEVAGEDDGGPCDWELRVDVSDEPPLVVRPATGRPCCVHVLRVRSLDALPEPRESDHRTWSGERTRIGPSRAVSDVRSDSRQVRPAVQGLGLSLDAALSRQNRSAVVTTTDDVVADDEGHTAAEQLWSAHLARLRDANVVSDPDEGPARLQTATRHRTEVALQSTRACRTGGHQLDVSADVSVDVDGEVTPATGTRLALPNVAGWIEGDLAVAATDRVEVAPGTEVHPAPGIDGVSGLAVGAAPGSGEVRATFTGHADSSVVDDGIGLLMAAAVVADLGLGEAVGHPAAHGRISVAVGHRARLVVTPHATDVEADGAARPDLGCACTPAYEVEFGVAQKEGAQAPHARLRVEGRGFRLDADERPGADRAPTWTVRADEGHDEASRGITG